MKTSIHSLAELFTYLAETPDALDLFKEDPPAFLSRPEIQLSAEEKAVFASAGRHPKLQSHTEPVVHGLAHYRFTPIDKKEVTIEKDAFKKPTKVKGLRRTFHALMEENVSVYPPPAAGASSDRGLELSTVKDKVQVDLYNYSIVYHLSIPLANLIVEEEPDSPKDLSNQTMMINERDITIEKTIGDADDRLSLKGRVYGYICTDGTYDISICIPEQTASFISSDPDAESEVRE